MIFPFSSLVKKNILKFLDLIVALLLGGVALSFLARYHWFFNLFDQFWFLYLILSIALALAFLVLKKIMRSLLALFLCLVCILVFYKINMNPYLHRVNSSFKIYYQNIKKSNAKIAALVEVTPDIEKVLTRNLSDYKNYTSRTRDDNYGFLILSKIDFKLEETYESMGIPVYVKIFIEKENIEMYLLHLPPPLWREAFEIQKEALAVIAKEIHKNQNKSFLIIGDLNMATYSSLFQDFYKQLNSSFYSQGLFSEGSWPSFMPEFLRLPIDHVLSNRQFEIKIGQPSGSDHKSIIVKIGAI